MEINKENIDELLIAYLLKELKEDDIAFVENWINSSSKNKVVFDEVKKIWINSSSNNLKFDHKVGWKKVSEQINKQRFSFKPLMRIAAILFVLISSYSLYQRTHEDVQVSQITSVASTKNASLLDGSEIKLNSHSEISYSTEFNKKIREVNLKGEAFFDIKRDVKKPFLIQMNQSMVEVLGTSFNINANPNDSLITVFVKSGLVRFSYLPQDTTRDFQEVELGVGEKVVYNKHSRKIKILLDKTFNQVDTYWIDKKLSFDGISLEKVAKIIELIYDVEILLFNKGLGVCEITVEFENDGIEQIMEVIANTFDIGIENENNTYILKGKACENK